MNRRRRIAIILLLGAVLVGGFLFLRFREPHYEGKSLNQWLGELANTTLSQDQINGKRSEVVTIQEFDAWLNDARTRHAHATKAIRAIGTKAFPHLFTLLHAKDSKFKIALRNFCMKRPAFSLPFRVADEDVQEALYGFHAFGNLAAPLIPELVAGVNQTNYMAPDIHALAAIGEPSIPALKSLLEAKDYQMRFCVAMSLGSFGPDGRCFIPLALERLRDEHKTVRIGAIKALGDIGEEPERVVPALIAASKDPEATVRWAAAKALGEYKSESAPAIVPALTELLNDPDSTVRTTTAAALNKTNEVKLKR